MNFQATKRTLQDRTVGNEPADKRPRTGADGFFLVADVEYVVVLVKRPYRAALKRKTGEIFLKGKALCTVDLLVLISLHQLLLY